MITNSDTMKSMKDQKTANYSCALTTIDNPYSPFDEFNDWFLFDVQKGYNSCSYLARIAKTSNALSDKQNDEEIERAIDEIVLNDIFGIYKKVCKNS